MKKITLIRWIFIIGLIGPLVNPIFATPRVYEVETMNFQVSLNKSRLIRLTGRIATISQSNPKIADLTFFQSKGQVLFRGKSLGTTNINVSYKNGEIQVIHVEVTHDLDSLKNKLYQLLPDENIEVRSAQKNIILSGEVSGLDKMQAALDIARSFLPTIKGASSQSDNSPALINMLSVSGAHQVMLEVKVAEIDRRIAKGLNIQFSAIHRSSGFTFGALHGGGSFSPLTGLLLPNPHSIDAAGLFLRAISGDFVFNLTVDAAKDQDLAKILAEPTLTTMSGQEATFISGGEFPIPVPQGEFGRITIVFKEFGISLRFIPVVLDSGRINLNMNVSVSELSNNAAIVTDIPGSDVKFSIPSLTKREASSTLELADGQTMSIAGLISDRVRENVNKFPGLGDVPYLGALFRSEEFVKQQTELLIFVTPKLAKPVLAGDIVLPTDSFVEPDDIDFYIFGKLESPDASEKVKLKFKNIIAPNNEGGMEGEFGHVLIEEAP